LSVKPLIFDIIGRERGASKTIRGIGKEITTLRRGLTGFAGAFGLAFSVGALINFGKRASTAYGEAEREQSKLTDAYERFPKIADINIEALRAYNDEQMRKTGLDDDDYAATEAQLAQYKLSGKQLRILTPLIADYARKTGKDLPEAAKLVGKALLGQGRALKDVGINFKDAGSLGGNFGQIVDGLSEKVGGFAEAYGQTAPGRVDRLNTSLENLDERVGSIISGPLGEFVDEVTKPGGAFDTLDSLFGDGGSLEGAGKSVGEFFNSWVGGVAIFSKTGLSTMDFGGLANSWIQEVGGAYMRVEAEQEKRLGILSKNMDSFFDKSTTDSQRWETVGQYFGAALTNPIQTSVILQMKQANQIKKIWDGLLTDVAGNANSLISWVNKATGSHIPLLSISSGGGGGGGGGASVPVRAMGSGGVVAGGHGGIIANIGEKNYDEMVTPLTPQFMSNFGGTTVIVNVPRGFVGSEAQLGRQVEKSLYKSQRRGSQGKVRYK
jgi:hypothetical protein